VLEFLENSRLLDVAIGIVIAAVSSWITVQLSLRQFRSERWWERKAEAYERIIGAFHDFKILRSRQGAAELQNKEMSENESAELLARAKAADDEILKAIDLGAFYLSDEAQSRLKQYQSEERSARDLNLNTWLEYLKSDLAASDACLKDLIQIAKRDLRTK
jgi:hypothetical protein